MREIKFRAWNESLKKMSTGEEDEGDLEEIYGNIFGNLECALDSVGEGSGYILMQFTGLLDKNGKEIYEGDVVSIFELGNAEVVFMDGIFVTYNLKCPERGGSLSGWMIPLEVIGNIYENPELLSDTYTTAGR